MVRKAPSSSSTSWQRWIAAPTWLATMWASSRSSSAKAPRSSCSRFITPQIEPATEIGSESSEPGSVRGLRRQVVGVEAGVVDHRRAAAAGDAAVDADLDRLLLGEEVGRPLRPAARRRRRPAA